MCKDLYERANDTLYNELGREPDHEEVQKEAQDMLERLISRYEDESSYHREKEASQESKSSGDGFYQTPSFM